MQSGSLSLLIVEDDAAARDSLCNLTAQTHGFLARTKIPAFRIGNQQFHFRSFHMETS